MHFSISSTFDCSSLRHASFDSQTVLELLVEFDLIEEKEVCVMMLLIEWIEVCSLLRRSSRYEKVGT